MNRQALAERIASVIEREDRASKLLGMRLLEVGPGRARLSMRVTGEMVDGQKVCHGGLLLSPRQPGDELTADAQEAAHAGRTRVYDVRVTNQAGEVIALFRGKSASVKGLWIEGRPSSSSRSR